MQIKGIAGEYGLEHYGLRNLKTVYWNLFPPELVEQVVLRGEGDLAKLGSVVVRTGQHTGRSPNDKFVVQDPSIKSEEIWWGKVNQPLSCDQYESIYAKMLAYLQGRDIFVQDLIAGAHPTYQVPIRVLSEKAWASLFAHNLFVRLTVDKMKKHIPEYTVLHCPDFQASPAEDGTNSSTFIIVNFAKRMILIQIVVDHLMCRPRLHHLPLVQQDRAGAHPSDGRHIVGHQNHRPPMLPHVLHLPHAFLLEPDVAHGQHLVDDQDIRVHVREDREPQPDIHPAGVMLHRRIDELFHFGKGDDFVELAGDLLSFHPQDGAAHEDVVAAGQFGMEAGAHF